VFSFFIHVGKMDDPPVPVRPANESWLENIIALSAFKHAGNRVNNFIKTKSRAFLNITIFLPGRSAVKNDGNKFFVNNGSFNQQDEAGFQETNDNMGADVSACDLQGNDHYF
jgi:hypothetical protein